MAFKGGLYIKGEKQGLISVHCAETAALGYDHRFIDDEQIKIVRFEHSITSDLSNAGTGQCKFHPFKFHKLLDKASPLLSLAMTNGEKLLNCVFKIYLADKVLNQNEPEPIHYYEYKLVNAKITSLEVVSDFERHKSPNNQHTWPEEVLTIEYSKLEQRHVLATTNASTFTNENTDEGIDENTQSQSKTQSTSPSQQPNKNTSNSNNDVDEGFDEDVDYEDGADVSTF